MTVSREWPEKLDPIVEEFSACFDSMERYELLFQYAKRNPSPLPPEEWDLNNLVSKVKEFINLLSDLKSDDLYDLSKNQLKVSL